MNRCWIFAAALAAVAALLFGQPALHNTLTMDDALAVESWPVPETPGQWAGALLRPWWAPPVVRHEWRPLAHLTILVQKRALRLQRDPNDFRRFYGFNMAAHAAVCLLLVWAAARWGMEWRTALVGTLLFAVHPLHLEAVDQIVGRTELMAAGWMLFGFVLWSRWGSESLHALWQQPLVYALALGSKEHAVLYPLCLALASLAGSAGQPDCRRRAEANRLVPSIKLAIALGGVLAGYLAAKSSVTGGILVVKDLIIPSENPVAFMPFVQRLPAVLGTLGYVSRKLLWPSSLSPDYSAVSLPYALGWSWPDAWIGLAFAAGLCAWMAGDFRKGGRGWALAAGGMAAWLLTSGLFLTVGVSMAPRLLYWPSAPACLGMGWLAVRLFDLLAASWIPSARRLSVGAPAMALILVGFLTTAWRDSQAWRSLDDYSEATLRIFPDNFRGRVHRALESYVAGDYNTGLMEARRAVRLFPGQSIGWGWVALNARHVPGGLAEAELAYRRALALDSTQSEYWKNYGNLLLSQGRAAEADELYKGYLKFKFIPDRKQVEEIRAAIAADLTTRTAIQRTSP